MPNDTTQPKFLPQELTLDGYTRADWSRADNMEGWKTTTLKVVLTPDDTGMKGFLKFLNEHQKAAYGTYVLPTSRDKNRSDGFLCIPFDQSAISAAAATASPHEELIFCKYAWGLGLDKKKKAKEQQQQQLAASAAPIAAPASPDNCPYSPSRDPEEDYVSSSLLGSLLRAQHKTDKALGVVPQGSVRSVSHCRA